jgi:hypothetical protein
LPTLRRRPLPDARSSATWQPSVKSSARCGSILPLVARLVTENGGTVVRGSDPVAPHRGIHR